MSSSHFKLQVSFVFVFVFVFYYYPNVFILSTEYHLLVKPQRQGQGLLGTDKDNVNAQKKEAEIGRDDVFPLWNSQILENSTEERRHSFFNVSYSVRASRKSPSTTPTTSDLRVFSFG